MGIGMARTANRRRSRKSTASSQRRRGWKFLLGAVFFLLLGAVLTNLDRLDRIGLVINQAKGLLPRYARVFIPEIPYGTASENSTLTGKIIAVYDGDTATLLAQDGSRKYKIRFYGIDAPEADQEFGQDSRRALEELVLDREVRAEVLNLDPYGRAVAKIYCGDLYVNKAMLSAGMAWWYKSYAKNEIDLSMAEATARLNRRGLWQYTDPQPPWEYRKAHP